jgi:hypothetical protein
MMTSRVRAINSGKIENEFKYEKFPEIVNNLLGL